MTKNSASFPSIPDEVVEDMMTPLLDIIKRQECAIVAFPPRGGAYRRIEHLLSWKSCLRKHLGRSYNKRLLVDISAYGKSEIQEEELANVIQKELGLSATKAYTSKDLLVQLQPLLRDYISLSLIIYDTDEWFSSRNLNPLLFLSKLAQLEPRIQVLLFCEIDVASPQMLKLNLGTTTLTQNILTIPMYDKDAITHFVHQLEIFWHIQIPELVIIQIIELVGCHIWLVKEAVRIYLQHGQLPGSFAAEPTMRFKLQAIWQQLSDPEKLILTKLVTHQSVSNLENPSSWRHLTAIGFIAQEASSWRCTLPILADFIKEKQLVQTLELYDDDRIGVDGADVSSCFGDRERSALVFLLARTGKVVKRDDLATAVWGEESITYSDWALDRLVSRLRQKIYQLGVNTNRLVTVKKVGWIWQ